MEKPCPPVGGGHGGAFPIRNVLPVAAQMVRSDHWVQFYHTNAMYELEMLAFMPAKAKGRSWREEECFPIPKNNINPRQ